MQHSNRLLGLIALLMGVGVFVAGFGIDVPPGGEDSLSPRFFPQLLGVVLTLLGGALCVQGGGESLQAVWTRLASLRSAGLLGLTALYTLGFGLMDFRLATCVFMAGGMWVMGTRNRVELVVIPLAVALLVYALFRYGFLVLLPVWG